MPYDQRLRGPDGSHPFVAWQLQLSGCSIGGEAQHCFEPATNVTGVYDTEGNMLVLGRKSGESIRIGEGIEITVVGISGNRVRLGIQAPESIRVLRSELEEKSHLPGKSLLGTGPLTHPLHERRPPKSRNVA
jgi:carbon storage regulator CsrA